MEQHQWPRRYSNWTPLGPESNSNKLDGGVPASYTTVHYRNEAEATDAGQIQLSYLQMQNLSGVSNICGAGVRFGTPTWVAGSWTNTTQTYFSSTTQAQSTARSDFPLETTTNLDGFMVGARGKFSCLAILVASASAHGGAAPVRELTYTTAVGWSTLSGTFVGPPTGENYATGETLVWFTKPADWAIGSDTIHATSMPANYYWIRVRATQAPSTVTGVASSLTVHDLPFTISAIANNIIYEPNFGGMYYPLNEYGECFVSAWATASAANTLTAIVRGRG